LGIEHIHSQDIVYRDIKAENVMVQSDGYVQLIDFGLSKKLKSQDRTYTFCGTPEYLAPEIIKNIVIYFYIGIWEIC